MGGKTAAEKAADAAAAKAGETAGVKTEEVREGSSVMEVVGVSDAAVAGAEALGAGAPGGPGVGAARVAEVVEDVATRDTPIVDGSTTRRRDVDDAVLWPRRDNVERPDLRAAEGIAFERPSSILDASGLPAQAAVTHRSGRDDILPLGAPQIDPASVRGRKLATATAQVRRNGRSYVPGEKFVIDFRAHTELVPIGAIASVSWDELPDA